MTKNPGHLISFSVVGGRTMRTLYTLDVLMLAETQAPSNSSTKKQNSEESYMYFVMCMSVLMPLGTDLTCFLK